MAQTTSFLSAEFLSQYPEDEPRNRGRLFKITHLNKYAWWLEDKGRRETWKETCARVTNYNLSLYQGPASRDKLINEAELMFDKMYHLEAEPAGRTLRIGGTPACYKFAELNFNCSFQVIDSISSLVDLLHISLCSVGIGFRVLKSDVDKLERFCEEVLVEHEPYKYKKDKSLEYSTNDFMGYQGKTPIYRLVVGDSKEGWVKSLETFLVMSHAHYHDHNSIKWVINYDNIRPSGTRIKTAGGFAAGHLGMQEMFTRLARLITEAKGKLSPTNAMDVANIIAKNVVTGGNRRAAQIALGAPDDKEFIAAKYNLYTQIDGKWKIDPDLEHRKMSNNSIVFDYKPGKEELADVFERIKNNGEPGLFNLNSARQKRPNANGINPCVVDTTWIMTDKGPRQVKDLINIPFMALVNGQAYKSNGFFETGFKPIKRLTTDNGYSIDLTEDHKVLTVSGWREAKDLTSSDWIVINNNRGISPWAGEGSFKEGWLLGNLIGDGCLSRFKGDKQLGHLRYWGKDRTAMANQALAYVSASMPHRNDLSIVNHKVNNYSQVACVGLAGLAEIYGITRSHKHVISSQIESASFDFYRGFLRGLFDADGSAQGNKQKGFTVRLSQSNKELLIGVQRMLARLGIVSFLHFRRKAGFRLMPDSNRQMKDYYCKNSYELILSRDSIGIFDNLIGFSEPAKDSKLKKYINNLTRPLYKSKFLAKFSSLEDIGANRVYDCEVEQVHRFDANGLIIHNCAEILLDNKGVCNLSTVVIPSHLEKRGDHWYINESSLEASVRLATRIGMRQTNVTLSLPEWDFIQKRDRLTGVSFTGWGDFLNKAPQYKEEFAQKRLLLLMHDWANEEADNYAYEMRIPRPLLVTAIKPEGTISQLSTVSSGLHKPFAPQYIRRMSVTKNDPLSKALKFIGVPWESDIREKESTREIFLFPVDTGAMESAYDEPAVTQLERYLTMQNYYTDHNSSCTIYVGSGTDGYSDEWAQVLEWVYHHWDDIVAVSFLPKHSLSNPPFPQMPYEYISKEKYEEMMKTFPSLDKLGDVLVMFEKGKTEYQELGDACEGGLCPSA